MASRGNTTAVKECCKNISPTHPHNLPRFQAESFQELPVLPQLISGLNDLLVYPPPFTTGAAFMPLGHMLTLKVAYQIATGLAYLHKKNIIFCDLKSDNILVWSLDVKEAINIKLSDYGISRQSFHEGALGVEGTPGYQAPEIRPRIVYDEKVCLKGLLP